MPRYYANHVDPHFKFIRANITYHSDNEYGIPLLKTSPQGTTMPALYNYNYRARNLPAHGHVCHFYTDDRHFRTVWDDPRPIINVIPAAIVEPNYSTTDTTPMAAVLWDIYRRRWLSHYFQNQGIPVFVDLFVHPIWLKLIQLGVPRGWNAFAVRGSGNLDWLPNYLATAQEIAGTNNPNLHIIGGDKYVRQWAATNNLPYHPSI